MKPSNWKLLRNFIKNRFCEPFKHPGFVLYFLGIVVLIGSIGVLSEIIISIKSEIFNLENITINLSNIFIALIASSSVELILIDDDDLYNNERKNDIRILAILFIIIGFTLWLLSVFFKEYKIGLISSIIGIFFSYFVWWISNAKSKKLIDVNPVSTLGGASSNDLNELQGDLSEFITK